MATTYFITHPEVVIDPAVPVTEWPLSPRGIARTQVMLTRPWIAGIAAVASSAERKATDMATLLAGHLGMGFAVVPTLGENDRSSTGYRPRAAFEALADAFFAQPETSIEGWERAVDAQARIVAAVAGLPKSGTLAVVAHGGVGALLLCRVKGVPISRAEDQPGEGGGNVFAFDRATGALLHGWQPIET